MKAKGIKMMGKKWWYIILDAIQILIILYVILVTCFILCKNKFGYTQFGNLVFFTVREENSSYLDGLELGSLVVINKSTEVKNSDFIYYYSVVDEEYVIKSGSVQSINDGRDSQEYIVDDDTVSMDNLIGTDANSYSNFGKVLDVLESKSGFLLFALLPIILIFVYQLYEFVMELRFEKRKRLQLENEIEKAKQLRDELKESEILDLIEKDDDIEII